MTPRCQYESYTQSKELTDDPPVGSKGDRFGKPDDEPVRHQKIKGITSDQAGRDDGAERGTERPVSRDGTPSTDQDDAPNEIERRHCDPEAERCPRVTGRSEYAGHHVVQEHAEAENEERPEIWQRFGADFRRSV